MCDNMGIKLYARFRSAREDWVQAMVMANIGFAFMPQYSVVHPASIQRPLIEPVLERTISLVTVRGRKHSPAVAAFIRSIRTHPWNDYLQGSNLGTKEPFVRHRETSKLTA
jgi:DNA-binding transcriptional LysR family regulator